MVLKFKNGEFDVEDKERSGRPKVYEDAELEALLDEDSCQTQKELALTLRSDSTNNFISFDIIGNDSKASELGSINSEKR